MNQSIFSSKDVGPKSHAAVVEGKGVLAELRKTTLRLEKKALQAKLAYAQAELVKVEYEQKALAAKMAFAKTEVETIQECLKAYEQAESSL